MITGPCPSPLGRDWILHLFGTMCQHASDMVTALLQRTLHQEPPSIVSALAVPNLPGRVYCETSKPANIAALLPRHCVINRSPILVPLADRTAILALPADPPLKKGHWVRVIRGKYRGDLGCFEKNDAADKNKLVAHISDTVGIM